METIDADGALEIIGKANQLGAACRARFPVLRIVGGRIAFGLGDRLQLELLDGAGHLAKLVLLPEARQHDVEIAARELAHRLAHRNHRPGNAAAEQQRQNAPEQGAADGKHNDQIFGLADHRIGLRFEPLLLGDEIGLHRARALADRTGRATFGGLQRTRILDQLLQRSLIALQEFPASFSSATSLSSIE